MQSKQKDLINILLFWLPAISILISISAIAYGVAAMSELKTYAETSSVAVLFFWLPILIIFINLLVIIYGISLKKINTYSKLSIILSLFFWFPAFNVFTSVLAIVFGIVFFRKLKADKSQKGKGLAIAGITMGLVTLFLSFAGLLTYTFFPQLME